MLPALPIRTNHSSTRPWTALAALALALLAASPSHAGWTTNGIPISPAAGAQDQVRIVHDGAGGVFAAWRDYRLGSPKIWLHRITPDGEGAGAWALGGSMIAVGSFAPQMVSDEEGGFYLAGDEASPYGPIYLGRFTDTGALAPAWTQIFSFDGFGYGFTDQLEHLAVPPDEIASPHGAYLPLLASDPPHGAILAYVHVVPTWDHAHVTRFETDNQGMPGWGPGGFAVARLPMLMVPCSDGAGGVFLAQAIYNQLLVNHVTVNPDQDLGFVAPADSSGGYAPGMVPDGSGGVFLFWQEHSQVAAGQPFVLRLLADLTVAPGWPSGGFALSPYATAAGSVVSPIGVEKPVASVATDGMGGAYIAWTDYRANATEGDIYAQHVLGSGTTATGWPADGLAICSAAGDQSRPVVAADGSGGLLIAWQDRRAANVDIYVHDVQASGAAAPNWPANGVAVCTADSDQVVPAVESDGANGAFVAWEDRRGATSQVYLAHVTLDGLVSTLADLIDVRAERNAVRLSWYASSWRGAVEVERRSEGQAWTQIARVFVDGNGGIAYADESVEPGARYGYRLAHAADAGLQYAGETWVTVPQWSLALDAPSPAHGALRIDFTLPGDGLARIDVLDVAGRLVLARDVGSFGAGRHTLDAGETLGLRSGLYWVRLQRAGESVMRRVAVVR